MAISNIGQPGINQASGSEVSSTKKTGKPQQAKDAKDAGETGRTSSPGAAASSKTEISDRGREIAKAKSAAVNAPDVREAKIAELKSRIEAGRYKVDADAVADRMVNEHMEMSGS